MSTSNQVALQNQSSDIYESFSSNQSNSHIQHPKKHSQSYIMQSVVFPAKPQHYNHLIKLYQQNRDRLKRLSKQVNELEATKLKKLRLLKNEKTEDDFAFQEIISSDVSKIDYYKQRRAARENQLKNLKQLYSKLNQINKKQAYLLNENHVKKAREIIDKHKKVLSYKITQDLFIVFSKQYQNQQKSELKFHASNFQQSNILIYNHSQDFYIVAVFQFENLIHWMKPKLVKFQLQEKYSLNQLLACKQQAEKDMINVKSIKIHSSESLTFLNYSNQYNFAFLQKIDGFVVIYDNRGDIKLQIQLDKCQQVLSLQIIKNQIYIGTKQGLIRIYKLNEINQIELTKITRCCSTNLQKIDKMTFKQGLIDINVVYSSGNKSFEYGLSSYQIIQKENLPQSKIKVGQLLDSYLQKIFTSLKESQLCAVDKYLIQKKFEDKSLQLLDIQKVKNNESKQNQLKLLLGDIQGNLFTFFIENI